MNELHAAIIGCGGVHHNHARSLQDVPGVRLVAVCDNKPAKAEDSAKLYGARPCFNAEEIFSDPDIDAVHITTPHYLHAPMTLAALKAGKYVLCEKPMATSLADAKAMVEAAHGKLGVIFQNRYNAASKMLKQIVEGGEYGKLLCVRGAVNWYRGEQYYSDDWHGRKALEGGGVMMNQAIHTLDLVQWLAGPARTVAGQIANLHLAGKIEVEDTADFRICFENGTIGTFSATTGYGIDDEVEVEAVLEGGTFWLRSDTLYRREHRKPMELICEGEKILPTGKEYWGSGHIRQIRDFYESIQKGEPIRIDGRQAFPAFAIIQALYASAAQNGAEVAVEHL